MDKKDWMKLAAVFGGGAVSGAVAKALMDELGGDERKEAELAFLDGVQKLERAIEELAPTNAFEVRRNAMNVVGINCAPPFRLRLESVAKPGLYARVADALEKTAKQDSDPELRSEALTALGMLAKYNKKPR